PHDTSTVGSADITGLNVIGHLNNGREQTIVIGAHYDHLGRNEHHNSTDINSEGKIHNGADDNASGVATVLEIARKLIENDITESSNFVFAFFSGEEDGLVGSKAFLEDSLFQSLKISCMLNLDMVGRMDSLNKLHVGGFGTSPVFPATLSTNNLFNLRLEIDSSGVGPSDHTSFYLKNIPVLFFFTGTHDDYHKPSDDVEKVNFEGLEIITNYVYSIALGLSSENSIPFTATRTILKSKSRGKISLGIMPNYTSSSKGLQVDGVSKGKPAEKGGILAGDIIIKINACEINDVYAYMDCLSRLNLGDKLKVTVIRNGEEVKFKVEL
ncbi:MAG: M20/M25/M40 family metallo-hydrolase, partial [Crocinitomicaceae bacterium]|nr:M20/M25/M40 family metallo-hydrolase [Crocinitomicaceae bacterium]